MRIIPIAPCGRQIKRLSKKYASFTADLRQMSASLAQLPTSGKSLGRGCYKVRLPITSKGQGARGGARLITYVQLVNETVFLLAVYDKSEQETISDQQVVALLAQVPEQKA